MIIIETFEEYLLKEDGEAFADLGNTSGMGDVVAPTLSDIPGDLAGSIPGSGDMGIFINSNKPYFVEDKDKKKKKKKQIGNFVSFKQFELIKKIKFKNQMITSFREFSEFLYETLYNSDIYIGPPTTPRKEYDIDVRGGISHIGIGGEFVGKGDVTALPERPRFISKIKDVKRRKNELRKKRIQDALNTEEDEYISNIIKIKKIQ